MALVAPQTLEDLFDVSGRVVVVTGAASGIGRAVAAGLADLGAAVYAVDVAAQGLEELASARGDRGAVLVTLVADVADEEAVRGVFEKALAEAGKVDVVFSNAGVAGPIRPTDELSLAEWHEVLAVNLDGSFLVGREAARAFKTGTGGKLIFTSSVWGIAGARGVPLAAYAASKGGVVNLVRQLALELAQFGITVNGIAPAGIRTSIADGFYEDEEAVRGLVAEIPLGRIVEPEELVGLAVFLASRASDYITGHTIPFDGGYLAR